MPGLLLHLPWCQISYCFQGNSCGTAWMAGINPAMTISLAGESLVCVNAQSTAFLSAALRRTPIYRVATKISNARPETTLTLKSEAPSPRRLRLQASSRFRTNRISGGPSLASWFLPFCLACFVINTDSGTIAGMTAYVYFDNCFNFREKTTFEIVFLSLH